MACIAARYTKGLMSRGCFSADRRVDDFSSIVVEFKHDSTTTGAAGRDHMLETVTLGHCNLDAAVFDKVSIKWLTDV